MGGATHSPPLPFPLASHAPCNTTAAAHSRTYLVHQHVCEPTVSSPAWLLPAPFLTPTEIFLPMYSLLANQC